MLFKFFIQNINRGYWMDTEIQSNYSLEGNYDGKNNVTPFFVPNQFGLSFVFCVEHN